MFYKILDQIILMVNFLTSNWCSSAVKNEEKLIVTDSSDKDIDNNADTDSDENDDIVQDFIGENKSFQRKLSLFQTQREHLQQQNSANIGLGLTGFATYHVTKGRPSFFQIIFSEIMLENIQKYSISEAQHVTGNVY